MAGCFSGKQPVKNNCVKLVKLSFVCFLVLLEQRGYFEKSEFFIGLDSFSNQRLIYFAPF